MKLKKLLFLVALVPLIIGCYELKQDEKGRTVKINKITGEVFVIEGNRIVKLKDESDIKAEQEATKKLSEAKTWPETTLQKFDGAKLRLITKWSDGNLCYQFFVDKNLRAKGDYHAGLSVRLYDNASFLIKEIDLPVPDMTGRIGLDGKTITSMESYGQIPMNSELYKKIKSWKVAWYGFDE